MIRSHGYLFRVDKKNFKASRRQWNYNFMFLRVRQSPLRPLIYRFFSNTPTSTFTDISMHYTDENYDEINHTSMRHYQIITVFDEINHTSMRHYRIITVFTTVFYTPVSPDFHMTKNLMKRIVP